MGSENAEGFIIEMKLALGAESDRELADKLGIDASTVATWRRRQRVPDKYKLRFSRVIGQTALPYSDATTLRRAYLFSLVRLAAIRLSESVAFGASGEYSEVWYGFRLTTFHDYARLALELETGEDKDTLKAVYDRVKMDIERPNFAEWIETLRERYPH